MREMFTLATTIGSQDLWEGPITPFFCNQMLYTIDTYLVHEAKACELRTSYISTYMLRLRQQSRLVGTSRFRAQRYVSIAFTNKE